MTQKFCNNNILLLNAAANQRQSRPQEGTPHNIYNNNTVIFIMHVFQCSMKSEKMERQKQYSILVNDKKQTV